MRTLRTVGVLFVITLVAFQAAFAQPSITSINPETGKVGRTVIITGNNFAGTPASNKVYFGAVAATVLSASSTQLIVNVPAGATYAPVTVTVGGQTATSPRPFRMQFNYSDTISTSSLTSSGGTVLTFPSGPQASVLVDLDGDGKPEIAAVSYLTSQLSVYQNTSFGGNLSFDLGNRQDYATGANPTELAAADIDGDGLLDIVTSNYVIPDTILHPGTFSVFLNARIFVGDLALAPRVDSTVGHTPTGLAVGDLDGDGRPEVVIVNQADGTVTVSKNNSSVGAVAFDLPVTINLGGTLHSVAISDIDGDGQPDLLVTDENIDVVHVLKNGGSLSFTEVTQLGSGFTVKRPMLFVTAGDLDLDGKPEVIATDTSNSLFVWRNASTPGNFSFPDSVELVRRVIGPEDTVQNVGAITLGDINGDGKPDIVVANAADSSVAIFRNNCTPGVLSFGGRIDYPEVAVYPIRPVIGDLDGDTHPELVVPGYTGTDVTILHNAIPDGYVREGFKVILQGPYSSTGDSMATTLKTSGILATHFGAAIGPIGCVDSINIELRNDTSAAASTIRRFAPAWLMKDGTIRSYRDTLKSFVDLDTVSAGSYYLVVRHRNHLAVMSRLAVPLTVSSSVYDFTTAQNKGFGTIPMIQVGSRFCLYAGDGNGSGIITASDANLVFSRLNNTGYDGADANASGIVTASDANIVFTNLNAVTKVP
jgi:hypothetical protein